MEYILQYFQKPENGILGVLVIILILVVLWQQGRLDKKDELINKLQTEIKNSADVYTDKYVDTVKEVVGTQKDVISALNLLQRSVDALSSGFQSFLNGRSNK